MKERARPAGANPFPVHTAVPRGTALHYVTPPVRQRAGRVLRVLVLQVLLLQVLV